MLLLPEVISNVLETCYLYLYGMTELLLRTQLSTSTNKVILGFKKLKNNIAVLKILIKKDFQAVVLSK